jgi:hypothetical protein
MEAFVYAAWDLRTDMNDLVFRVFDPLLARLFFRFKNKLHLHTCRVIFDDNEVTEIRKVDPGKKQVCSILDYPRKRLSIHRRIPSHVHHESHNSGPQPNGDPKTNSNENP